MSQFLGLLQTVSLGMRDGVPIPPNVYVERDSHNILLVLFVGNGAYVKEKALSSRNKTLNPKTKALSSELPASLRAVNVPKACTSRPN